MWVDSRLTGTKWHGGPVEPAEVLYDLDGPAIFTTSLGPAWLLFLKIEEQDATDVFLAAPVDEKEIGALKAGRLSIRGAMSHREAWIVEVDYNFNVIKFQEQVFAEYEHLLPKSGVALYSRFSTAPDTLEQAEAFMAFKFESPLMSALSMPLSVLKSRIDAVSHVVKQALLPTKLAQGRKSRFFDVEVAPLRFASLLIAIKDPQFNQEGLLADKETVDLNSEDLLSESRDLGTTFLNHLTEATDFARTNKLTKTRAKKYLDLLEDISNIVPTTKNDLTKLQISFRANGEIKFISIDKSTGDKLIAARDSIEFPTRSISGIITELNDDAKTFILRDATGRQLTVNPTGEYYKNMIDRDLFRLNQPLKVTGRFWERTRRDYMVLTADVRVLKSVKLVKKAGRG